MATVRQHLQKLHENAAEHHSFKKGHHDILSKHYAKLSSFHKTKSDMDAEHVDAAGIYSDISDSHAGLASHYQAQAEFHGLQAQECAKAMDGDLNKNRLVPDKVSGVTPPAPAIGSRMIPRAGAPNVTEKPIVPLEFEKLVEVEDSLD
jgi:hypothetical protein